MYILLELSLIVVGVLNFLGGLQINSVFWLIFGCFQVYWGIKEICKFHCAGDCLGKTFDCRNNSLFKPSIRCKINQELIKYFLIKRIAQNKGLWIGKCEAKEGQR